ncbi:MAG: efflux RND transporter periplasmic adaptor subunit [Gemmatimonadota bacterium]
MRTTGQVRSAGVAHLKAENTGTVAQVLTHPGARVSRGELLVQLDPRPFDLAVDEAMAVESQSEIAFQDIVLPDSIVSGQPVSPERRKSAEARSGLLAARVRLERAQLDREQATIKAPFAGIVDEVSVAAGERVSAGQAMVSVVDLANIWVEAAVLEHDLPVLRIGGDASVVTPAAGAQSLSGTISAVLPLIDSITRAGRALIKVRGAAASDLRPGMYADVKLESGRLAGRILVPAAAVIERDGRPLVFVVKHGKAQWVYINPGRSNGSDTEVLPDSVSGQIPVAVGDTVIVEGHLTLTHDASVRVTDVRERIR